jgi:hypothetical protein
VYWPPILVYAYKDNEGLLHRYAYMGFIYDFDMIRIVLPILLFFLFYYPFWTLLSYQLTPFVGVRLSPQVNSSPSTLLPNPKTRIQYFPSKVVGVTPIRLYTKKGPGVTKAQRNSIKVTQPQHEIIVGSLLGDLFATKRTGPDSNTRLSLTQGNLGYLLSYQTLLGPLIRQVAPTPTSKLDKLTGKTYKGFILCTMSLPCLNYYRDWFYPKEPRLFLLISGSTLHH